MAAKSIEERIEELQDLADEINSEIRKIKDAQTRAEDRMNRFVNGEKDLGAKGVLERLIKMEDAYKQYEILMKVIEWGDKLIGWAKYVLPLIGAAMAFSHWNIHGTNEALPK